MPCNSGQGESQGDDYEARRRIDQLKAQLDSVTSLLCAMCRALPSLPAEVAEWYERHKAWDKLQGR